MFWQFVNRNRYAVFFMLLLFCFFQFSIRKIYGFSIFPDEFSYWAYAAEAAGCDWSEVISLGSFYSYGYSILLLPIFMLCKDPITAYRAAVALNFVLLGLSYMLLLGIQRMQEQFFVGKTERQNGTDRAGNERMQIYAGIAVLYAPMLFYAQTTMVETVLMCGYLLLIMLVGNYLREPGTGKLLLVFAVNFFLYVVHMRTVGTLAVCAGLLLFTAIRKRKDYKEALLILAMTVGVLLAAELLEGQITAYLYHDLDRELYEINTYEGQLEKIKYIFSKAGWAAFAAGFGGKILYLGISTYGLGWWGLLSLLRQAWHGGAGRFGRGVGMTAMPDRNSGLPSLFVALSVMAQIVVSTVYNVIPDSYDSITFGRYQDYVMPVLIAAGIEELSTHIREKKRYFLLGALLLLLLSAAVSVYAAKAQLTQSKGYFMAGMSFFEMDPLHPAAFYTGICVAGILCMGIVMTAIHLYAKTELHQPLLSCALLSMALAFRLGSMYLQPFNELARQDLWMAERMEKLIGDGAYEPWLTYLDYNEISAVGLVQFALRDLPVKVAAAEDREALRIPYDMIGGRSIVLLGANDPRQEELEGLYDKEVISGHFVLLYNAR